MNHSPFAALGVVLYEAPREQSFEDWLTTDEKDWKQPQRKGEGRGWIKDSVNSDQTSLFLGRRKKASTSAASESNLSG